ARERDDTWLMGREVRILKHTHLPRCLNPPQRTPTFRLSMTDEVPDFSQPPFRDAPEARFEPAPADGVMPEGFFCTSNLPTYVRANGRWLMPVRPRMDGVIVRRGAVLGAAAPRLVRRGRAVAMGLAN